MSARLWVRLWWWARARAAEAVRNEFPGEYSDARRAWGQAALSEELLGPGWNTRGLATDLALHDAADSLLGVND